MVTVQKLLEKNDLLRKSMLGFGDVNAVETSPGFSQAM